MTPDELRPLLAGYRATVEKAWSDKTAHPDFASAAGSPVGQCGVTSAWLQQRLNHDHGIATTYCIGIVWADDRWSEEHCWLEIPRAYRIVIDATADQVGLEPVLCGKTANLSADRGIFYTTLRRLSGPDVAKDPVYERLALLEEALCASS